ncbi:MAG: DNA-binding protein [Synergistaceae bacterium]|nr:DNA-binding protein [Synergistaceae bacterium]
MEENKRDLTESKIDRKNILNNTLALNEIQKATGLVGVMFQGKHIFFKEQIASYMEISPRTIDNYLAAYSDELKENGYVVIRGEALQSLKKSMLEVYGNEIDFVTISKTSQIGVFDFRAFLNIAMLIVESDRARQLRKMMLDIVIDTINMKCGGTTKYINQRDENFIMSMYQNTSCRREFTDALRDYVEGGNFKYVNFTNKIYVSIFAERNQEYRSVLKLAEKDRTRDTMYSEILNLIASYEVGLAEEIKKKSLEYGRKLKTYEVDKIFSDFESMPLWKPLIIDARCKMASRDLAFRDALHKNLEAYINSISMDDFERFLGQKSMELSEQLEAAQDVMKRLKERA